MMDVWKNRFLESLDSVQLVSKPAKEGFGEDSFFCSKCARSAIVSVFDGCGGLGAKIYPECGGHTGAYLASRAVSGAVCDWYHTNYRKGWSDVSKLTESIDRYIRKAYDKCKPYLQDNSRIRGSLVRQLPTTMALAFAETGNDGITIHVLWAGDSRVYLLDQKGLAQLTLDDTYIEDALENLRKDSPLSNLLSADGKYVINYKTICVSEPALVFAATDGCFAYLSTPMDFEYLLLKALVESENPASFRKRLRKDLALYAGDDLALGLLSFFYGNFTNTREMLRERLVHLEEHYIRVMEREQTAECEKQLWASYKPDYERYLQN